MESAHANPAEAVRIHREVGARRSVAMHWGTFQLTDEGREEPVRALALALATAGLGEGDFAVLAPGASLIV
jgi:N-acyl-phosphatidylethanolamine-hydrolysing phospholipase D